MDVEEERGLIREAFAELFPDKNILTFGSVSRNELGVCDGNQRVQWNAGIERERGQRNRTSRFIGVNLEGSEYDGWPLLRLLQRERHAPRLFDAVARTSRPEEIRVQLLRDAWAGRARPKYFHERFILPFRPLADLTLADWTQAVTHAMDGLDLVNGMGIVKQEITFTSDGHRIVCDVKPYLHFGRVLWDQVPATREERIDIIRTAMDQLRPLYNFVEAQSG